MPAVSLPLQQAKTNVVALAIDSPSPSRLGINLAFLALCLLLLVAYYFKFTSWNRALLAQHLAGPQTSAAQRHGLKGHFGGRSRGISSTKPAMPTSPSSDLDRLKGDGRERPERADNIPCWFQQDGDTACHGKPDGAPAEDKIPLKFKSRPPPPPPMTPLALETGPFHFQERRHSATAPTAGDSAIPFSQHQKHGSSAGSSTSSTTVPGVHGSPISPRRRSYTKTLSFCSPPSASAVEVNAAIPSFTPHSFPSSSAILPPPPHDLFSQNEVEVHGEIISVMDDDGMGWKRHTRVYGGGPCLACLAAGGEDGGFYGPNVPLEDRRY